MGLNDAPSGERVHIVFFGVRNVGKSSLVNAVTGQETAVVSDAPGTTTDPVRKAMELLPAGPVLIVDTPGVDDAGKVGDLRVQRALAALDEADAAVLVVDATSGPTPFDESLVRTFQKRGVPYVIAENKGDLLGEGPVPAAALERDAEGCCKGRVRTSAATGAGVADLKGVLATLITCTKSERRLVGDLLAPGDVVVLVIPLDSGAPKGRIILPQQQVLRDALAAGAFPCATGVEMLPALLEKLPAPPRLVVTDSQAFGAVDALLPADVPLTSFSILMARYKGDLSAQLEAVQALERLADDDVVLIAEGCTHHRQCDDIGTVKLPAWIRDISGASPRFAFTSGRDFPADLRSCAAVVHCGGCMLSAKEMASRLQRAREQRVPFTNYGMVIARAHDMLARALAPLS
ncbi:[FeFe] hydrogenase H-cluster maturation GTPase HydF [Eggerthellaceae bacterium zg-893]|nr:[FeFe] hydrogenase H-cluster maturation GTPase HydF [Eggerthellaceae bacterium zg-893]